jgi:putative transposase
MTRKRRSFSGAFKAKVALAACRGDKTTAQLAAEYEVHVGQITAWKKQLLEGAAGLFEDGRSKRAAEEAVSDEELYEQIGRLKMEVEWLKKKLPSSAEELRRCIESEHKELSIVRQCALIGLAHSTWYYRPAGESAENLALMRAIDEQYLRTPFYGSRKLAEVLGVNRKRIQRLMRVMGIEAIYPKRRTTWPGAGHKIYPYLLRNVAVTRPDQVLAGDITYVPLRHGFLYLVAIMDWYSRYVLSWRLSNTLTGSFCLKALEEALSCSQPDIFNSDQGSQFTAAAFTSQLESKGVAISMTRKRVPCRGRAIDNVFVERLWRSVKYEEVYLKDYVDGWQAEASLAAYFRFYNHERIHQSLGYRTPADVYHERRVVQNMTAS